MKIERIKEFFMAHGRYYFTDLIFAGIDLAIIDVDLAMRSRVASLRRSHLDRGVEYNF
jgi:hypothetical protein